MEDNARPEIGEEEEAMQEKRSLIDIDGIEDTP